MRLHDIKDTSDLRDLSTNDVVDLLDELRAVATKRGTELLEQGREQARRALGAPAPGAVGGALMFGIILGALVGAIVAVFMTPVPGREARQRLAQQAEQLRDRMPDMAAGSAGSNGRSTYGSAMSEPSPAMPSGTARPMA